MTMCKRQLSPAPAFVAFALLTTTALSTWAQTPEKRIPPSVLMEVRLVESRFNAALADDCAPDKCYSKGCSYADHLTLDTNRSASLPGLPAEEESPGNVKAQDYLTRAKCGFAYEKSVTAVDVKALARRLRKKLSHGWLTVSVVPSSLDPLPKSLLEGEPLDDKDDDAKEEEEPPPPPPEPEELTGDMALLQLWKELLPHFWWMLAIGFLTFAVLMFIWAGRRLGATTLEEKMMEAQLAAQAAQQEKEAPTVVEEVKESKPSPEEDLYAEEQERLWNERLERMDESDEDIITRLLQSWLKAGDYPTLARALFVFGDRVAQAFDASPEIALRKVEFANYFRDVDESTLPSRGKFFKDLNQQAMASLLLSQDDVSLYRSLREDFGASGVVGLTKELPPRYGALVFALATDDQQREIAPQLSTEQRNQVAAQLLMSTRMSLAESDHLTRCVEAVKAGQQPPAPPTNGANREHGPPIDSATALSNLLPHVGSEERQALFAEALKRQGGAPPHWYEDIVFNHMLTQLPDETRNDLLLEVDIRGLAAWLRMQPTPWRRALVAELSEPLQNAIAQSGNSTSRADQVRWARKGHDGLVKAFKSAYARRGLRFVDLVG